MRAGLRTAEQGALMVAWTAIMDDKLSFKGDDFIHTDIRAALPGTA
jgi:uncharacterized protein with PIN domain